MNELLDAALKYATEYGWAVFPVSPHTKKPITPHGCKDAKKDPGAIKFWWKKYPDASIGVATGKMSNLLVIDEDIDEEKGIDGVHSVDLWERDNGELPETWRVKTGRGGAHLYFHYTGKDIYGNRAGMLEGVDVRGEGGYVIAPPSIHPNGTRYEWESDPEETELSEVTEEVKRLLHISKESHNEKFQLPQTIPAGQRNEILYRLACSLQSQGLADSAIFATVELENEERCAEPLEKAEIDQLVTSALTHRKGELKVIQRAGYELREPQFAYKKDKDGNPICILQTIKNCEEAIMYDPNLYGRIRFNELSYSPYVYGNLPWKTFSGWREWSNSDDSNLRSYIESNYGLKFKDKIMDALNNVIHKQTINPVKEMLETALDAWDGNKHVENLLTRFVGAEKTLYNIEVMHRYMLGAVKRIYQPGCKFDYMLILVGKQGSYKSSFLKFLAVNDEWFADNFNTLDGDKAFEKLRGMWIVEMSELQATKRAKDVESIKAFITSTVDSYRTPYERRTEQRPRQCVLAGTSNPVDFLTDKTGNRRFLPVTCSVVPVKNPYDNYEETRMEFIQAWGEIMDEYKRAGGNVSAVLPKEFEQAALDAQMEYLEDDPNIGIIQEWLDHSDFEKVCAMQIWRGAMGNEVMQPTKRDINNIHEIMKNNIEGWEYVGKKRIQGYGIQRSYERTFQNGGSPFK